MLIPIRCWSCGKPIAHLWEDFKERTSKGDAVKVVLDDLGVESKNMIYISNLKGRYKYLQSMVGIYNA